MHLLRRKPRECLQNECAAHSAFNWRSDINNLATQLGYVRQIVHEYQQIEDDLFRNARYRLDNIAHAMATDPDDGPQLCESCGVNGASTTHWGDLLCEACEDAQTPDRD